ncbi:hypothetical protein CR513_28987, partial [Mucuna pruriens]
MWLHQRLPCVLGGSDGLVTMKWHSSSEATDLAWFYKRGWLREACVTRNIARVYKVAQLCKVVVEFGKPIVSHTPHTLALVPFPWWCMVLQYSILSIEEVQTESKLSQSKLSQSETESTFYVPSGIPEDYIKMKAFPFSLDGATKDWLYLQPVLFNTWGDMKRMFLEKLFPASRTATIKKEIYGIRQHSRETLHEYWERFNKLCATCPHHQISEQLLIQYFYEGLMMMDRSMIDTTSGGALMDKTPVAVRHLISNMASNTQQFGIKGAAPSPDVGAIDNLRLENQLIELTSLVRQLAIGQHQPNMTARVYRICTSVEHPTDMCPTLQETEPEHPESVGSIGGYQYGKQLYQS